MDTGDDATPPTTPLDSTKRTHTDSFDPADGPIETIVDLVAGAADRSILELTPLYDVVDPDALNALFGRGRESSGRPQTFAFTYEGYRVTVCGDGTVTVTRPEHPAKVTDPLE